MSLARRKPVSLLPSWARWPTQRSWLGRPIFLRHCVYSRYASFKNDAATCVCTVQQSLGHLILKLGQAIGGQPIACSSAMVHQIWLICWFLSAQLTSTWEGLHLKQWISQFIKRSQSWVSLGTQIETRNKTQARLMIPLSLRMVY